MILQVAVIQAVPAKLLCTHLRSDIEDTMFQRRHYDLLQNRIRWYIITFNHLLEEFIVASPKDIIVNLIERSTLIATKLIKG